MGGTHRRAAARRRVLTVGGTPSPRRVVRAGRRHPVAVVPLDRPLAGSLHVVDGPVPVDGALRALGADHLAAQRRAHPAMHDGEVLAWRSTDGDGRLVVARGGYFDAVATCDVVRVQPELADAVHAAAGGDALTSGDGRVAALGVSVLLDVGDGLVVLGLRSARNAADVGRWHVAPSGMAEPSPAAGVDPLASTVARELVEELGVALDADEVARRGRVVGLVHDLERLRPDVVVHLPLTPDEAARVEPGEEFDAVRRVRPDAAFWAAHGPGALTAPAAGALALWEERALPGRGSH